MFKYNIRIMGHSNKFYGTIFLIIIYFIFNAQCGVNKCCSIDSVLKTSDSSVNLPFSCELTNSSFWDTFNIPATSNSICIPNKVDIIGESETILELNGCLDFDSKNRLVALSCTQNDRKASIHLLNKCCPIGQSYDHSERVCVVDSNSHLYFENLFGDSVVALKNQVPTCTDDEVSVEYFSNVHQIHFVGKNLQVNGNNLSPTKFCIEDLINIVPNGGDIYENEKHIIVRSCRPRSVCSEIPCIRRCCNSDQVIQPGAADQRCQPHPKNKNLVPIFHDVTFPLSETQTKVQLKDYGVLHSWGCKKIFPLRLNDADDLHYLHKNGNLHMTDKEPFDQDRYCIENVFSKVTGETTTRTFLCFEEMKYVPPAKFDYYKYGLAISCIFLASTLIVYLSLPKLLNLHGKTLVSYVISFLAAYITLATLHFNKQHRLTFCYEVGFFLLYCLIAAFCWQSVMCFDIWLTFGSLRSSFMMRHNRNHQRKFLYYSAYAWGIPFVWILITMFAEKFKPLPIGWNPGIGSESSCFFASDINWRDHFVFFLLPAGLHVIANCVLFTITAINCSQVKSDIHRMQCASDESNVSSKRNKFIISKALFIMNLKLFTVMGISWILEIISTFTTNRTIEAILDLYNIFLGVFIFFIFVFKRKVLYELKSRFGKKPMNAEITTPRTTTITNTNISLKDMTTDRNTPLLTSSALTLQVPSVVNK